MSRPIVMIISIMVVVAIAPLLLLILIIASISSRSSGLFLQTRIGQHARPFTIYKFRTMNSGEVTGIGKFLRKTKLDELPQLINIVKGDMTFVGPRPDVPGYYDQLTGKDRRVLELKPGLTSLAAIKYRNEEELLEKQENPAVFNDHVIFPDKVRMNLEYLENKSFSHDFKIIWLTIISLFK